MSDARDILRRSEGVSDDAGSAPRFSGLSMSEAVASASKAGKPLTATALVNKMRASKELAGLLDRDGLMSLSVATMDNQLMDGQPAKDWLNGGLKRPVRNWVHKSMQPAGENGLRFNTWVREDQNLEKNFPFERLWIEPDVVEYTDDEYEELLESPDWTREATDELLRCLRSFCMFWGPVHGNWEAEKFGKRSIEDMRERYFDIVNQLEIKKAALAGRKPNLIAYDAEHERRRKEQLEHLWNRTPEEVEEEKYLRAESKKIEQRQRERARKEQKVQDQIEEMNKVVKKDSGRKKAAPSRISIRKASDQQRRPAASRSRSASVVITPVSAEFYTNSAIKFTEIRCAGVFSRRWISRLPANCSANKSEAIARMLVLADMDSVFAIIAVDEANSGLFNETRAEFGKAHEMKLTFSETMERIEEKESLLKDDERGQMEELSAHVGEKPEVGEQGCYLGVIDESLLVPPRQRKAAVEQMKLMKAIQNR